MINLGLLRSTSIFLTLLIGVPPGFAQIPRTPGQVNVPVQQPEPAAVPLTIAILEGSNSVNSISSLRSIPPIVEVRDQNDFPVEGATVVFTLPASGPGGRFPGGASTFSTRSDSHGQAAAPLFAPINAGKFEIQVTASLGNRKGEVVIHQTNSTGEYSGPPIPSKPFYKKPLVLALIGAAVAGTVVAIVLATGSSSTPTSTSTSVTITPGSPIFH